MTTTEEVGSMAMNDAIESIKPIIERNRDRAEADRRLPDEVFEAIYDAGLLRLWMPKESGGEEVDIRTLMSVVESLSRIYSSAGWVFANTAAGAMQAAFMSDAARREAITDPRGFSVAGSVASVGRAVEEGEGYRLSGQWRLASGCHHTDWLGAAALIFDGEVPRMSPDGSPDVKLMLFRRSECEILDTWNPMGMKGTGSTDFRLGDVFIPAYRSFSLLTAPPLIGGPLYQAGILVLFGFAITAVLPGIARAAIDAFVELARDKVPAMSQTTLATRPTVHAEVARAEMLLQSARAYVYEVADDVMTSLRAGNGVTEELEVKRRLACVNVATSCVRAVDMVYALAGTTSIHAGHPLEQSLRDIHTAAQHFLVSQNWLEKTGQSYFGLGLGMP